MITTVLPFLGVLLAVFIVLKILSAPFKLIIKVILNGLIGGIIIYVINLVGANFNFVLPLEWWSSILVGILGIPGAIILILIQLFM